MRAMVLTAAAAIALCAACARKTPPDQHPADAGASLSIAQPIHDFGAVTEGDKLAHTFELSGSPTVPVGITRVETSAPWVTADLKTLRIPPGGKGQVEVSFDTLGRTGDLEKRVTVVAGDPKVPAIQLYVRAHVAPMIAVEEESEEREEDEFIYLGDHVTRELKLVGPRAGEAHLAIERITSPDITADIIQQPADAGPPRLRVTVTANTLGHYHGGVFLSTGIAAKPTIMHFFEWVVLGNVTVAPRAMHFEVEAASKRADGHEQVALVRSRLDGFVVRSAKTSSPAFSAEVKRSAKDGEFELHVRVANPDVLARTDAASVELSTNDKIEPVVRVPIAISRQSGRPRTSPAPSSTASQR